MKKDRGWRDKEVKGWVEHMCSPSTYPAQNNTYAEAHPQVYSHINDTCIHTNTSLPNLYL